MFKLLGLLLTLASFPVLFLNEGRAVRTAKSLEEGAAVVVHIEAAPVNPVNDGKLVHFTGQAVTTAAVRDPIFGIEARALQLSRKVEMYQWKRTTRGRGDSQSNAPGDYERVWSEQLLTVTDSRNPGGHENPPALPYKAETISARDAQVGDFQVPRRVIASLDGSFVPLSLDEKMVAAVPNPSGSQAGQPRLERGSLYFGGNPAEHQVGDVRIHFATKGLSEISVIGRQHGQTIEPFPTRAGRPVEMARVGSIDAQDMFDGALTTNTVLTWVLRVTGYLLMSLGIFMVVKVRGLLRFIPLFGSAFNAGAALLAFVFASAASLAIIALAWIAYRPALSLTLLILSGAFAAVLVLRGRREPRNVAV